MPFAEGRGGPEPTWTRYAEPPGFGIVSSGFAEIERADEMRRFEKRDRPLDRLGRRRPRRAVRFRADAGNGDLERGSSGILCASRCREPPQSASARASGSRIADDSNRNAKCRFPDAVLAFSIVGRWRIIMYCEPASSDVETRRAGTSFGSTSSSTMSRSARVFVAFA